MKLVKLIVPVYTDYPFYGYRKIAKVLEKHGITRKQVRRIMQSLGLKAIVPRPNTSKRNKEHKIYPYLLKNKLISFPNQVWATDITYIKVNGGYVYLAAILDLFSRKVLSWRLSNTMETSFCIEALEEALHKYGCPAIFNTDQGSQFTSEAFTGVLKKHDIRISMDSKGRALDNIYVERLWRSFKYEDLYIKNYENMAELKKGVKKYFHFYNTERFHQSLNYETPSEIYHSVFNYEAVS